MTGRLEVWVRSDTDLAVQDQHLWYVSVLQNDGTPLVWQGDSATYLNGRASFGYWSAEVPPGFYLVYARRWLSDGELRETNSAVVQMPCQGTVCSYLRPFTDPDEDHPVPVPPDVPDDQHRPKEPQECTVGIALVRGRSGTSGEVVAIDASGTAADCAQVSVRILNSEGTTIADGNDSVDDAGAWSISFDVVGKVTCGEMVIVNVRCAEGNCEDVWQGDLECVAPLR